ncbi:MAG TPA: bifunctional DedA family/phosphatase PAP2 family protein [Solirubrobacterales bacterium]|nr:bifunctional DedA family/phosphatase PAP2 family protein [Solirubrobacterales bacterium]
MKLPGTPTQRKWASRLAIVVAIAVAYYLFTQVLDLEKILEDVAHALGAWTYALVGFFAFAETGAFIGLVAPGETVMLLGGAVAGQGAIDLYLTIALAWTMACAGDVTSFFLGRRLGREFLLRHGPRFGFGHDRLEQVEDFFSRHGGKTIFLGRFVGFVRAFAPFIAGSSGMRFRQFFPYSVLGCGIWVSATVVIGYVFSRSIDTAIRYAGKGAFLLGALIVVVVGTVWAIRFFRVAANRRAAVDWLDDHAATRWIVAFARRHETGLRLIGDRLTPGGSFGLEFTSLMAVLAVAVFVLVAYIVVVGRDPGPTPGDETAVEVVEALRCGFLTGLSKLFTFLGSGGFVWALTAVCAVALAWRRHWTEVCVLLVGMALIQIGVHELKAAVDRPRPPDGLVAASGSSFPSGHAAHSVIYVWAATTIVVRLRPGMARAALVVVAGIVLTALVGLSRIYLNVHYLSDVSAGWALGAACFSICAAIGLVVSQLRHNPQQ